jgi:hypothetical protein
VNKLPPNIVRHCYICNSSLYLNQQLVVENTDVDFSHFADKLYKKMDLKYPKFHKMDSLSKLGFLAAEILLNDIDLNQFSPEMIAVNIQNKNSSLDTDIKYAHLIQEQKTSPSIFVYTLPNIMIGEICIRHQIKGENLLLLVDQYQPDLQYNYLNILFKDQLINLCICGWIDFFDEQYEAFLFLVENKNSNANQLFTLENVQKLYKTYIS